MHLWGGVLCVSVSVHCAYACLCLYVREVQVHQAYECVHERERGFSVRGFMSVRELVGEQLWDCVLN